MPTGMATVVLAIALGCSQGPGERVPAGAAADSGRTTPPTPATPPAVAGRGADSSSADAAGGPAPGDDCPMAGSWQRCSVEKRLERAGLAVRRDSTQVRHDFLDVPGDVYRLGRGELQVFLYPSAAERQRDWAGIDSARVAPEGKFISWPTPPTLIVSENLAAILLSLNGRLIDRVQLALTAGLPAASTPR
jgi:hypothetical protein